MYDSSIGTAPWLTTRNQNIFHEAIVNITRSKVEKNVRLGPNTHAPGDFAEIHVVERIALEDEGVKKAIQKLQLPKGTVLISDPWIYGICLLIS